MHHMKKKRSTCCSLRCDCSKFTSNTVTCGVEMCKSVAIATSASKLLTSAAKIATDKAEPQVLVQVATGTVGVLYKVRGITMR